MHCGAVVSWVIALRALSKAAGSAGPSGSFWPTEAECEELPPGFAELPPWMTLT